MNVVTIVGQLQFQVEGQKHRVILSRLSSLSRAMFLEIRLEIVDG